nr:GLPGLI family protein [Pedobacter panaciterrae]
MKKLLFVIWMCSSGIQVLGQNTGKSKAIDSASLRCYYLLSKKKEGELKPFRSDTMILDIGSKRSKFYDPARLGRDSLLQAEIKNLESKEVKSVSVFRAESAKDLSGMPGTTVSNATEGESYQIVKDKQNGKISVFDYAKVVGDRFKYEDDLGGLKWEITDVTDTVASYNCQKATLNFRGRDYIAWFTTEIPLSDGPWKFSGLPGLVLKVEDSKGLFSFRLIGMKQLSTPVPILIDDSKSIKCSRADFEKMKKKQGPGTQVNFNGGNVIIAEIPQEFEYISMELE